MPEFVLFGDSLTEWSFDTETQGFGLFLEQQYQNKVHVVNAGRKSHFPFYYFSFLRLFLFALHIQTSTL